jgi:hypothetical protein
MKNHLHFFLILAAGVFFIWWHLRTGGVAVASVTGSDTETPTPVSPIAATGNPIVEANTTAPPQQTYNSPTQIMAADPSTQAYLTGSQTAALLQGSLNDQLQNAVSTGLVE